MKKIFYYKKIYIMLLISIIFTLFLFISDYRFTPIQAVISSLNDNKIVKIFREVERD